MPISKYFHGAGEKVASSMADRYGPEKGKKVFYATANARGMNPPEDAKRKTVGKRLGELAKSK